MYRIVKYWFLTVIILLIAWFFTLPEGFLSHMPIFIWIVTAIAVTYKTKKSKPEKIPKEQKISLIILGSLTCLFSFISVPIGFGNPPYSIAEFSILLSGITLIIFTYREYKPILLPSSIPLITIIGFQIYELFEENINWIATPLLEPTTNLTVVVLNILGLGASQTNNTITFLTQQGQPMNIPIVIDCTGIWSLGAFTASMFLVMLVFPQALTKKGAVFIAAGYVGTYLANILRITLICMSAYLYGYSGATQLVHIHAGWIAFSLWMITFWYLFFSHYLLKK